MSGIASATVAMAAQVAADATTRSNGAINHGAKARGENLDGDRVSLSPAATGSTTGGNNDVQQASFQSMGNRVTTEWSAVEFHQLLETTIEAMASQAQ